MGTVYTTRGGVRITRTIVEDNASEGAVEGLIDALDSRRGVLLASSYEYPGRYTRWDMGFVDPPLELSSRGRVFAVRALNDRGRVLLGPIAGALGTCDAVEHLASFPDHLDGTVHEPKGRVPEEERSKQPSLFSVMRVVMDLFGSDEDPHLGLYGAFGYDLAFQFEPIDLKLERPKEQRDLLLYLPDELVVVDHQRQARMHIRYDFDTDTGSTIGMPRGGEAVPFAGATSVERECDHEPGEYAKVVELARDAFHRGDLFEAVPGQVFFAPGPAPPSEVFRRLRERNPSPYGFLINLGSKEYLVGASPEMYVRVEGNRVETCPIAGTIARGDDPIGDAAQILSILNSPKDEAELTMCTDVDRNDKARICVPGSVKVIGRRQIEMYSRLIHTVDHVEGRLRDGYDALDAFLTHTWAVTVTGAPKTWAMQFIEDHERSARAWYGGAVGLLGFNGNMNTGLTLRTMRINDGVVEVRAGATLLWDSVPEDEEAETRLKAAALLDSAARDSQTPLRPVHALEPVGRGKKVLLVDHQDSFVHTLADYVRQTGAECVTLRAGFDVSEFDRLKPDLVLLSPGPGTPSDFDVTSTVKAAVDRGIPLFGVCLGLQGIVEAFGGSLGTLDEPMHGKPSEIRVRGGKVFRGLPSDFMAGRYHSLFANRDDFPEALVITAETDDGVVMALEHRELPIAAVQFHPESILTLEGRFGHELIRNVISGLTEPLQSVHR
jgi:anthranilate synthase